MYVSMWVRLGGGRVAWWAWDSRNGSRCEWVCVYVDSNLRQVEAAALFFRSSIYVQSHFEQEMRASTKRQGEKEHRGKMEAEISVTERKKSPLSWAHIWAATWLILDYRNQGVFLEIYIFSAFKSIVSLLLISCIQTNQAYFTHLKSSQQRWLCKHLLLTWIFYSISFTSSYF